VRNSFANLYDNPEWNSAHPSLTELTKSRILDRRSPASVVPLSKVLFGQSNVSYSTRAGRFQFVFGREVSLSFYHNGSDHPILIPTPGVPPANATLVSLSSLQVEFPILEYRIFRTFSLNQSSSLTIQPYVGFDKPRKSSVVSPTVAPKPDLQTIVTAGVRVVFDWRHYVK